MLKLIGTGANRYYAWDLLPGSYVIGRKTDKSECDFLIADMTVSRRHARLDISDDGQRCFLTDLHSHNGTYINGEPVTVRIEIYPGTNIQFGNTDFRLVDDAASSSVSTRTQITDSQVEHSVVLPMDEALKPLPSRVIDLPELLPTLFDMARMLVLPEPKEEMLQRSLEMVAKLIPADRLAVFFTSEDSGQLHTGAMHIQGNASPGTFTLSRTIVNEVLSNRSSIRIDAKSDPRFAAQESIIVSEMKSAMAAPLLDEDKVLGILYADTANPIHHYNDDYLRLFATIGHIISSRLTNSALLQERQKREVFEAELARASLIQKNLLPRSVPSVPGYAIEAFQEQCRAVGGDLYDVELLHDGRLLFMVADVSGKGMGAALLMSNILASFRILYLNEQFSLERAVSQVSQQLFKHSASENFATLFIGVLDPGRHSLTFINAGHNPPLLIRNDGRIHHLEPCGTMIGAFDFSDWSCDSVSLDPGDLVVVFTDGLTEAEKDDEFYSDERLEACVRDHRDTSPDALACIIMKEVEAFVKNAPRSDDVTMLIIKRNR